MREGLALPDSRSSREGGPANRATDGDRSLPSGRLPSDGTARRLPRAHARKNQYSARCEVQGTEESGTLHRKRCRATKRQLREMHARSGFARASGPGA